MRNPLWLTPFAALLCATSAPVTSTVHAEVVYSNLPFDGTYVPVYSYSSEMLMPNAWVELAWEFTPSATGSLTRMRSAIFGSGNSPVILTVYESVQHVPGDVVASWTFNSSGNAFTTPYRCRAWDLSPSALVHAGHPYFISIRKPSTSFADWWWYLPTPSPVGPEVQSWYRSGGAGPWIDNGMAGIAALELSVASCGSADFNHDGETGTDADIEAFFACLAGNCCPTCDSVDFNHDGDSGTDADIEAFFRVLAGGNC